MALRPQIRRAAPLDTREMAALLNEIIAVGGTTARTEPVRAGDFIPLLTGPASACHVAEVGVEIMGFQFIEPSGALPPEAADISTFVRRGKTGLGLGSALFEATAQAARDLGYRWINATIRADNAGGLIYYQSRGFRDWRHLHDQRLANGMRVDKICKRFDLD
jgi:L-amino acid N-acyltransferase YncA